jgi:hypothetical protein
MTRSATWMETLTTELRTEAEAVRPVEDRVPTIEVPIQHQYMVDGPPALWRFRRWAANVLFRAGRVVAP